MEDTRLQNIDYMVQASDFERTALEMLNSSDQHGTAEWVEDTNGFMRQVGQVGDHEIWVTVWFVVVNDRPIAFYYATSAIVDWTIVVEWAKGYAHGRHCDASNFAHALRDEPSVTKAEFVAAQSAHLQAMSAEFARKYRNTPQPE